MYGLENTVTKRLAFSVVNVDGQKIGVDFREVRLVKSSSSFWGVNWTLQSAVQLALGKWEGSANWLNLLPVSWKIDVLKCVAKYCTMCAGPTLSNALKKIQWRVPLLWMQVLRDFSWLMIVRVERNASSDFKLGVFQHHMLKANTASKTNHMYTPSHSQSSLEPWMTFTHC